MSVQRGLRTRARLGSLLGDLLDDLATESLSPAASSVAAMNVAIAAALTAKSARRSAGELDSAAAAAAQADSLRRRALLLVSLNTEAYEREVATLSASAGGEGSRDRNLEIRAALTQTSDALVSLLQVACDVCVLADLVARRGKPGAQMDAAVAATQAEAGARAAMELIETSLLSDELLDAKREAREAMATASEAAGQARAAAL